MGPRQWREETKRPEPANNKTHRTLPGQSFRVSFTVKAIADFGSIRTSHGKIADKPMALFHASYIVDAFGFFQYGDALKSGTKIV